MSLESVQNRAVVQNTTVKAKTRVKDRSRLSHNKSETRLRQKTIKSFSSPSLCFIYAMCFQEKGITSIRLYACFAFIFTTQFKTKTKFKKTDAYDTKINPNTHSSISQVKSQYCKYYEIVLLLQTLVLVQNSMVNLKP